jgi:signal transduction histidine kinase
MKPSSEQPPPAEGAETLRRFPLFADLSDADLERLSAMATHCEASPGERFIEEGEPGESLYVIEEGEVEITRREGGREVVLATRGPGEFIGEMSLLEDAPRSASARALRETRLLVVHRAAFQTLLSCSPSAPLTLLRTVSARLRSTEALLMQQEKLAALGTLAAGLAHELNNPAAAIRRATTHLLDALTTWERAASALAPGKLPSIADLPPASPPSGDALARSSQEDELAAWLELQKVEQPEEAATVLVEAGWDRERAARLSFLFPSVPAGVVVTWMAAGLAVRGLVDEVSQSARAISDIVGAVKRYAYLDQAPLQEVDLHESLESTLVILRHKLKGGVRVERDYAPDLPRIEGYGSELNQVWTNLIDNAVDAMGGEGNLRLRTRARPDDTVWVEVHDSGPGIPPEVQARLFEPFFTTKPVGEGTGLGLHLAYTTVVQRHRGQITASSQPGETCFRVTLPVRLAGR